MSTQPARQLILGVRRKVLSHAGAVRPLRRLSAERLAVSVLPGHVAALERLPPRLGPGPGGCLRHLRAAWTGLSPVALVPIKAPRTGEAEHVESQFAGGGGEGVIVNTIEQPIDDPELGRFTWDRRYKFWLGGIEAPEGNPVDLTIHVGPDEANGRLLLRGIPSLGSVPESRKPAGLPRPNCSRTSAVNGLPTGHRTLSVPFSRWY